MDASFTARVVAYARQQGVMYVVAIQDLDKRSLPGGEFYALPGGRRKLDEYPFQTAQRELEEETGLCIDAALCALKELGSIQVQKHGTLPHSNIFFSIEFPFDYVTRTLENVRKGLTVKKERNILSELLKAPLESRDFLGTHYIQLQRVASELHRTLFN